MITLAIWIVIVGGTVGLLVSREYRRGKGAPTTLDFTGTRLRWGDREQRS